MPLYYFDSRDGERFIPDDEGIELDGIESARDAAPTASATSLRTPSRALYAGN